MSSLIDDPKLIGNLLKRFEDLHGSSEGVSVFASPASLLLLGDHTQYNEGVLISLPVNRYYCTAIRARKDKLISYGSTINEAFIFTSIEKINSLESEDYKLLRGLTQLLIEKEILSKGFDCVVSSNVPDCFGLGSYAAMQVSFINNLCKLLSVQVTDFEIADLIKKNELNIIGKISNTALHFTAMHGVKDKIFFMDLRTKKYDTLKLSTNDYDILVCDTDERIVKPNVTCNERIEECEVGIKGLRLYIWGIKSLRDIEHDFLLRHYHMLPRKIFNRVLHNVNERKRAEEALKHLRKKSLEDFGVLVTESHWSLSRDFEIGNEDSDFIVTEAVKLPGVLCSKMISCTPIKSTINIVDSKLADNFISSLGSLYQKKFHHQLKFHRLKISGGIKKIAIDEIMMSSN